MGIELARVLFRKDLRLIVATALLSALLGLGITYVLSERYEATTILEVNPGLAGADSDATMAMFLGAKDPYSTISETDAKLVSSRRVAVYVVEKLGLDGPAKATGAITRAKRWVKQVVKDAWAFLKHGYVDRPDPYDAIVSEVQKALAAQPVKPTYLLAITATAPEPELAADIADAAAEGYIVLRREQAVTVEKKALAAVDDRLAEKARVLAAAEQAVQSYQAKQKTANLAQEVSSRIQAMVELEIAKTHDDSISRVDDREADRLIARYRAYVAAAPEKQRRVDDLLRKAEAAEGDYLSLMQERRKIVLEGATRRADVTVVDQARPPLYPARPVKVYYAGLAAVLGLLAAWAYVILRARLVPAAETEGDSARRADEAGVVEADEGGD